MELINRKSERKEFLKHLHFNTSQLSTMMGIHEQTIFNYEKTDFKDKAKLEEYDTFLELLNWMHDSIYDPHYDRRIAFIYVLILAMAHCEDALKFLFKYLQSNSPQDEIIYKIGSIVFGLYTFDFIASNPKALEGIDPNLNEDRKKNILNLSEKYDVLNTSKSDWFEGIMNKCNNYPELSVILKQGLYYGIKPLLYEALRIRTVMQNS